MATYTVALKFTGMEVHVGCSGWFYWHWRGIFYPDERRTDNWFRHYAAHFRTVELNAPFYSWPKPATVRSWKRNAPPGFRYSVKVNQLITHEKRLRYTGRLVREFYSIADVLREQLGCFLFQFPPSYRYTPARLESITRQLDPAFRSVVEFRHKSWWRPAVYRRLSAARLIFCSISAPRFSEELIQTSEIIYVRFHGRSRWYRYDYSQPELEAWAEKITAACPRAAWIYFNNDREGHAIRNALELRRLLTGSETM